jgi:D-alanyl-D-alanine carboxypeptidase/D-alanyl-D-alanine-endopeptidase (penicillin-binding protein 4)
MKTKKLILTLVASTVLASNAMAKLITQCSSEGTNGAVEGSSNLNAKFPIASVSKVFTSLWAMDKLGGSYRYPTQVYITQLNNGAHDVHLRGSVFPYFDRTMFYFLIGELNKRGITKIDNLTYDENFEYGSVIRDNKDLAHKNGSQSETEIMKELRSDVVNLSANYRSYLKKVQPLIKMNLPTSVKLSIKDIHAVSMTDFDKDKTTSTFVLRASELHRVLKEMNRNSNNFAANKIYERLERTQKFSDYLTKAIGADANEFTFVNGSGYPEMVQGVKTYNSATCNTVINVNKKLFKVANAQNLGLRYILPVAGLDADADADSTVTHIYSSNLTEGALLAKTGTISQSISLAGAIRTQNDLIYFHATSTTGDYQSIKTYINSLIKQNGGNQKIDNYTPQAFLPFDEKSISEN